MVRNISDKDDTGMLHQGIVRYAVSTDVVSVVLKLLNYAFLQAAAGLVPEFDGRVKFFDIVVAQSCGKGV